MEYEYQIVTTNQLINHQILTMRCLKKDEENIFLLSNDFVQLLNLNNLNHT